MFSPYWLVRLTIMVLAADFILDACKEINIAFLKTQFVVAHHIHLHKASIRIKELDNFSGALL